MMQTSASYVHSKPKVWFDPIRSEIQYTSKMSRKFIVRNNNKAFKIIIKLDDK